MSNRVKPKADTRPSIHTCPFCRSWTVEVPAFWQHLDEVQEMVAEHVGECIKMPGVQVTFK